MDIRPVGNGFGSGIWVVNLTKTDDVLQREPKKVLLRHQVLIIREQNLSPSQQLEFSKGSGPLDIHVRVKNQHPDYEEVSALTTEMKDGKYIGAPHAAVPTERCSDRSSPPAVHPVVRTRPETGKKALYVTERFTLGIEEMDHELSEFLFQELFEVASQSGYIYRHKWRKGDVVICDNSCLMHIACGAVPKGQIRHMH